MRPEPAALCTALLRLAEPERAHRLGVLATRLGLAGRERGEGDPILATRFLGMALGNPIGLAAGFDKEAAALRGLARLGFGALEAGSVTLHPQPGNPRPRLFRLPEDRAVINRYGMNSAGLAPFQARLARLKRPAAGPRPVPVGANLGLNKESAEPERDYAALAAALAPLADYLVINVSSPNTPGLRDLQAERRLAAILAAVRQAAPGGPPLLVKVAPDLGPGALEAIVEAAVGHGARGLIVANTTIARDPALRSATAAEAGGLSGQPLFAASTALLARAHRLAGGRLALVGVGGVGSGAQALAKIRAGAGLVQLYTALVYEGPGLVGRIKRELAALLRREGFRSVGEAVGSGTAS